MCEQCVRDGAFVCTFIAEVCSCGVLDVDFFRVEYFSACKVASGKKE